MNIDKIEKNQNDSYDHLSFLKKTRKLTHVYICMIWKMFNWHIQLQYLLSSSIRSYQIIIIFVCFINAIHMNVHIVNKLYLLYICIILLPLVSYQWVSNHRKISFSFKNNFRKMQTPTNRKKFDISVTTFLKSKVCKIFDIQYYTSSLRMACIWVSVVFFFFLWNSIELLACYTWIINQLF